MPSQHKTGTHPFYIGMYIHIYTHIYVHIYTSQKECLHIFHVVQALIEIVLKNQSLKACGQSYVMNFLIETLCKCQGLKALGQIEQQGRHFVTHICHFCNPIQRELFILNVVSKGKMQGSEQVDGDVGSRHVCPLTPKSLLFQTFIQHKPWSMGYNQL